MARTNRNRRNVGASNRRAVRPAPRSAPGNWTQSAGRMPAARAAPARAAPARPATGNRTPSTGMSRGRFLKTAGLAAAGVGAAAMGVHATEGDEDERPPVESWPSGVSATKKGKMIGQVNPDPGHIKDQNGNPALPGCAYIEVYPRCSHVPLPQTGIYRDVDNVQWAVDNAASGGTVRLMTTDPDNGERKCFYFGEDGTGWIQIDRGPIRIEGEKLSSVMANDWTEGDPSNVPFALPQGGSLMADRATIFGGGGSQGFYSGCFLCPLGGNANNLEILSIKFVNSSNAAIRMEQIDTTTISDVIVWEPIMALMQIPGPPPEWFKIGIFIGNDPSTTYYTINGDITIEHCLTNLHPDGNVLPPPSYSLWMEGIIFAFFDSNPKCYIRHNTILNSGQIGLGLEGMPNAEAWVEGNHTIDIPSFRNGRDINLIYSWGRPGPWVQISGNICENTQCVAIFIDEIQHGSIIDNNTINFSTNTVGDPTGVWISWCQNRQITVSNNTISFPSAPSGYARGIGTTRVWGGIFIIDNTINFHPTEYPPEVQGIFLSLNSTVYAEHNIITGRAHNAYNLWKRAHWCYIKICAGDLSNFNPTEYHVKFNTDNVNQKPINNTVHYYAPDYAPGGILIWEYFPGTNTFIGYNNADPNDPCNLY